MSYNSAPLVSPRKSIFDNTMEVEEPSRPEIEKKVYRKIGGVW